MGQRVGTEPGGALPDSSSRYRVLAKWAAGGMADVYVARQQGAGGFDKLVALKFLRDQGDAAGFRQMFLDEVKTAALLSHPGIVQTFDAGELGDRLYMAMEFINGETLSRFARGVIRRLGAFPVELALWIARDLANALEYAHTLTDLEGRSLRLVHRDVSPSNVLLSFEGNVKLLDFGIARVATKLQPTQTGVIKGKFSYMSPEQAAGDAIDHRSDIYSLAIVLWQLLTGQQAFQGDNDAALLHKVLEANVEPPSRAGATCSEVIDELVMGALARRPDGRYACAADFAAALSACLAHTAPGYDGTKTIRDLMAQCFSERKERLAKVIRGHGTGDMSLEEIDLLGGASIRTPSPRVMFPGGSGDVDVDIEISVAKPGELRMTPRPSLPVPIRRRPRWWVAAALGVLVAAPVFVFLAYRNGMLDDLIGDSDGEPPRTRETARAEPTSSQPAAAAPGAAPPSALDPNRAAALYLDETERLLADHRLAAARELIGRARAQQPTDPALDIRATMLAERVGDEELRGDVQLAIDTKNRGAALTSAQRLVDRNPSDEAAAALLAAARALPEPGQAIASKQPAKQPPAKQPPPKQPQPGRPIVKPPRVASSEVVATEPPPKTEAAVAPPPAEPPPEPRVDAGVVPPPPVPVVGTLDAIPSVSKLAVEGSLPASELQSALGRMADAFRSCYRSAARKANKTPALRVSIAFEIDEGRRAINVRVGNDSLGVAACMRDALSGIHTRVAPDVGTAVVTAEVKFQPTK